MTQYRIDSANLGRALIGFDELFNSFENRLAGQIQNNYPPFNVIQLDESNYEIEIAVAGFKKSEIDIELNQQQLIVSGEHEDEDKETRVYHHRGLAARNFERSWTLEQYVEVRGAEIKDGILTDTTGERIELATGIQLPSRITDAALKTVVDTEIKKSNIVDS